MTKRAAQQPKTFSTILIANRGEIACRVMRTAHKMGYKTVAVFSEADSSALHVRVADQAISIGGKTPAESYLSIEKILEACKKSGADAVHPGYGFLSENADFAQACQDHGLIFIGPPAKAIDAMGNKSRSKELMLAAGVPCIPGYQGTDQSPEFLLSKAKEIGFPLMIKAAAGGGGRGLRLAYDIKQVPELLQSAKAEAEKAFGSGELLLEKALIDARHVEVQVFGDQLGNVVHLGERDCSIQRRHQKVFEESPSPVVSQELRNRMGESAVRAAKAIEYVGAGTVEFLLDADGNYYFLEMNTRLQVEHPVTEMITGFDLVEWQLNVAAGKPLPLTQEEIRFKGHAIEARLYAEDPANDFRPQVGPVLHWSPAGSDLARTDHGLNTRDEISPYYDSMVAKIIAYGADRAEATRLLDRALCDTTLLGVVTNREFLVKCLRHEEFKNNHTDTGFIARTWGAATNTQTSNDQKPNPAQSADRQQICDNTMSACAEQRSNVENSPRQSIKLDASVVYAAAAAMLHADYGELTGWSSSGEMKTPIKLEINESAIMTIQANYIGPNSWRFQSAGQCATVALENVDESNNGCRILNLTINGINRKGRCIVDGNDVHIAMDELTYLVSNITFSPPRADAQQSSGDIFAPSNGLLAAMEVTVGQFVERGTKVCMVEAMKLMQPVCASMSGYVKEILVEAGKQVKAKQLLVRIEPVNDQQEAGGEQESGTSSSDAQSQVGNQNEKKDANLVEI